MKQKISAKRLAYFIPVILWMVLIFWFSSQGHDESSGQSQQVVQVAYQTLGVSLPEMIVRKAAHTILYAVLGILAYVALSQFVSDKRWRERLILSVATLLLYAISDELHQLLIDGRSGQVSDVILDTIAGGLGIGLYILIKKRGWAVIGKYLSWLLAGLMVLSYITAVFLAAKSAIVPIKYLVITSIIIGLIVAAVCYGLVFVKAKKHKWWYGVLVFLALSLTVLNINIASVSDGMTRLISQTQSTNTEYTKYNIVVLKDYAGDVQSLADQNVGLLSSDPLISQVTEELAKKVQSNTSESQNLSSIGVGLLDGNFDAVVIRDSYMKLYQENFSEFYDNVKVIDSFSIETNSSSSTKDTDVTKPFIVYISGIDTYGSIDTKSRSDVNILAVVNPVTHKVLLVNTPRDYYVQLHGTTGQKDKLTHAGVYGVETSRQTMEDLYGVKIDFYVRINFNSLVKLVDTLGGVDVYSAYAFDSFHEGYNHLDGKRALEFSRERYSFSRGDRVRGENQQRVIEAIIEKLSRPQYLVRNSSIVESMGDVIQTDIGSDHIAKLINHQLDNMAKWRVSSISVDGEGSSQPTYSMGDRNLYVMIPDQSTVDVAKSQIKSGMAGK